MDINESEMRVYEFSYLIAPEVQEEAAAQKVEDLKNLFVQNFANIIDEERAEYIGLAYTIIHKVDNKNKKINSAYFGWFKFQAGPNVLDNIKMTLDRDVELVRYMLIKTVAESTLAPKKLSQKAGARRKNPIASAKMDDTDDNSNDNDGDELNTDDENIDENIDIELNEESQEALPENTD